MCTAKLKFGLSLAYYCGKVCNGQKPQSILQECAWGCVYLTYCRQYKAQDTTASGHTIPRGPAVNLSCVGTHRLFVKQFFSLSLFRNPSTTYPPPT